MVVLVETAPSSCYSGRSKHPACNVERSTYVSKLLEKMRFDQVAVTADVRGGVMGKDAWLYSSRVVCIPTSYSCAARGQWAWTPTGYDGKKFVWPAVVQPPCREARRRLRRHDIINHLAAYSWHFRALPRLSTYQVPDTWY